MADVRYWVAGSRAFAYTPHRQSDGKFYAIVYAYDKASGSSTAMIKKRAPSQDVRKQRLRLMNGIKNGRPLLKD